MKFNHLCINGETWEVQRAQLKHWGECNPKTRTIIVSTRLGQENAEVTLLHEVIHALFSRKRKKYFTEEEVCKTLDEGLTTFLKDNPHFRKVL